MKVLDLQCDRFHTFEGWFGSESDFQTQLSHGQLFCPVCGSAHIAKKLSAPRLNLKGANTSHAMPLEQDSIRPSRLESRCEAPSAHGVSSSAHDADRHEPGSSLDWQDRLFVALREAVRQTEDVGEEFVEQARRMHYGEQVSRPIRGKASVTDTLALLEEGIEVLPLPHLPGLNEPLQ